MQRLARPIENIRDHYAVVVVGSGYGGGIAASRLSRAGQQVCLLERGKEFLPGEYPDTAEKALPEMQFNVPADEIPDGRVGPRNGLYDFHLNQDMHVFVGCGLGGTSLVNANVSLRAEPRVFQDARWPEALRNDYPTLLEEGYRRAEEMLQPTPYPADFPTLPKLVALERSAAALQQPFYRPPINVTFADKINHVGVPQKACTLCGDCCSGCNYGAKNTTLMNYLPDAVNHGAEIFTQVLVRYVEKAGDGWLVYYEPLGLDRDVFAAPLQTVHADIVILAAGTLGSTEILLRSRERGLPVSKQLGEHFTGNGDVLAFSYNGVETLHGIGNGAHPPVASAPVGPCITGIIDIREQANLEDGMVIEEGSIPGPLAPFLPSAFALASLTVGADTDNALLDRLQQKAREMESLVAGAYHGAVQNTQTYLVMSHDNDRGRMVLEKDRLRVLWPGAGSQPILQKISHNLDQATVPAKGIYIKDPIWSKMLNNQLITVHPLGGCVLAEDAERGVVNHKGQVFAAETGTEIHTGLYVSDGSVMPRELGVNPLLTISALAERNCKLIADDHGWTIDYALTPVAPLPTTVQQTGLQFTETMRGFVSTGVTDDYLRAEQAGKEHDTRFQFTLTVISEDLDALLSDENHAARLLGTVTAPCLSPAPLTVTEGNFQLFVQDPNDPQARLMRYRMKLTDDSDRHYYFDGFKVARTGPATHLWPDTTTLFVTLYAGEDMNGTVVARGILHILPEDFLRQMTTLEVKNAPNVAARLKALARFGSYFGGVLYATYGHLIEQHHAG